MGVPEGAGKSYCRSLSPAVRITGTGFHVLIGHIGGFLCRTGTGGIDGVPGADPLRIAAEPFSGKKTFPCAGPFLERENELLPLKLLFNERYAAFFENY
jgi:hypothetical protein